MTVGKLVVQSSMVDVDGGIFSLWMKRLEIWNLTWVEKVVKAGFGVISLTKGYGRKRSKSGRKIYGRII